MINQFKILLVIALIFGALLSSNAQSTSDSTQFSVSDTSIIDSTQKDKKIWSKAEKAALFSALLPGLGQAYNKKYWKMPIIYVVSGTILTGIFYTHSQYKIARNTYIDNDWEENPLIENTIAGQRVLTKQNYKTIRDRTRSDRDLYIIVGVLFYGLNIMDAIVDAHLSDFDLSDDLSLNIKPNIFANYNTFAAGLTLNLNFK